MTGRVTKVVLAAAGFVVLLTVATALLVLLYTIGHDRELADRDRYHAAEVARLRREMTAASEARFAGIEKWMVAVYVEGSASGWKLPDLPFKEKSSVSQKAVVQPAGPADRRKR
jgi:hypothetical protein